MANKNWENPPKNNEQTESSKKLQDVIKYAEILLLNPNTLSASFSVKYSIQSS